MPKSKPFYLPCGCCGIDLEEYEGLTLHCSKCDDYYCDMCFGEEYCIYCESKEENDTIEI